MHSSPGTIRTSLEVLKATRLQVAEHTNRLMIAQKRKMEAARSRPGESSLVDRLSSLEAAMQSMGARFTEQIQSLKFELRNERTRNLSLLVMVEELALEVRRPKSILLHGSTSPPTAATASPSRQSTPATSVTSEPIHISPLRKFVDVYSTPSMTDLPPVQPELLLPSQSFQPAEERRDSTIATDGITPSSCARLPNFGTPSTQASPTASRPSPSIKPLPTTPSMEQRQPYDRNESDSGTHGSHSSVLETSLSQTSATNPSFSHNIDDMT
jgi:hypothetical protein